MPQRFVVVDAWVSEPPAEWRAAWDAVQNATDGQALNATLQRAVASLPRVGAPTGVARWLLAAAAILLCAQVIATRILSRRFLKAHGMRTKSL